MASMRPPRNLELEGIVIEALTTTSVDSPVRREAWAVYADWLLSRAEPVGEWLAASLRLDAGGEVAAPVRARLGGIEQATRFRLVDLELADLSEVPELERIAEFTWERGFITSAVFRGPEFRAWDSELLGHTPDRFLAVVLRSPSACMLHELELHLPMFRAIGARYASFAELLADAAEPLALRALAVAGARTFDARVLASMPDLDRLRLGFEGGGASAPGSDQTGETLWSTTHAPRLRELEIRAESGWKPLLTGLARGSLLARLEQVRVIGIDELTGQGLLAGQPYFDPAEAGKIEVRAEGLSAGLSEALRESAGFRVQRRSDRQL